MGRRRTGVRSGKGCGQTAPRGPRRDRAERSPSAGTPQGPAALSRRCRVGGQGRRQCPLSRPVGTLGPSPWNAVRPRVGGATRRSPAGGHDERARGAPPPGCRCPGAAGLRRDGRAVHPQHPALALPAPAGDRHPGDPRRSRAVAARHRPHRAGAAGLRRSGGVQPEGRRPASRLGVGGAAAARACAARCCTRSWSGPTCGRRRATRTTGPATSNCSSGSATARTVPPHPGSRPPRPSRTRRCETGRPGGRWPDGPDVAPAAPTTSTTPTTSLSTNAPNARKPSRSGAQSRSAVKQQKETGDPDPRLPQYQGGTQIWAYDGLRAMPALAPPRPEAAELVPDQTPTTEQIPTPESPRRWPFGRRRG